MMPRAALGILAFLFVLPPLSAQLAQDTSASVDTIAPDNVCSRSRGFAGPCTTVRGRLRTNSDNVVVSMWKVGTTRLLGIQNEVAPFNLPIVCRLPDETLRLLAEGKVVYADFVIRPLTKDRPGVMGYACIASASNMVGRPGGLRHPLFQLTHR